MNCKSHVQQNVYLNLLVNNSLTFMLPVRIISSESNTVIRNDGAYFRIDEYQSL